MGIARWWEHRLNALSGRYFWGNASLGVVGSCQEVASAQSYLALSK